MVRNIPSSPPSLTGPFTFTGRNSAVCYGDSARACLVNFRCVALSNRVNYAVLRDAESYSGAE